MLEECPVRVSRRTGRALVEEVGTADRAVLLDDICALVGDEFSALGVELEDWFLMELTAVGIPAVLGDIRGRAVVDAVGIELDAIVGGVLD